MKNRMFYRTLTIGAPIVSVLCAAGVSLFELNRLHQLQSATVATEKKLVDVEKQLREFASVPRLDRYPTEEKTPREQALFLDMLRGNAEKTHVQLVRWSNTTPAPAPPPANGDANAKPAPSSVTPIISMVEVLGEYANTRQFLYNLLRSRRLLNMSDLKWVREKWPTTHLTFTLTRYVGPSLRSPLDPPDTPGTTASSSPQPAPTVPTTSHPAGRADTNTPMQPRVSSVSGGASNPVASEAPGGFPNPMNAPGMSHGYQTKLESNIHDLSQAQGGSDPASLHPPASPASRH